MEIVWFYELKINLVFPNFDHKFALNTVRFEQNDMYFVLEMNDSFDIVCVEYFKQENILFASILSARGNLTEKKL